MAQAQTSLGRQVPHPGSVGRAGVRQGVLITEPGEVVVARIGIAALAVGQVVAYGVIVVALDALNAGIAEQRKNAIGMRAKSAKVAEAAATIHATATSVVEGSF